MRRRPPAKAQAPFDYRNLILAAFVLLGGAGASFFGFQFGQKALEDVSSPRTPSGEGRKVLGKSQGLLKEAEILGSLTTASEVPEALTPDELLEQEEDLAAEDSSSAKVKVSARSVQENVSLSVDSLSWQGSNLVLQVSLQNKSYHAARFAYSPAFGLLVVTDDQGKPLRTVSEGLPPELPDDRQVYKGNIQIPASELGNSRSLNLSLTDYPDRQLQFQLNAIPVPPRPQ